MALTSARSCIPSSTGVAAASALFAADLKGTTAFPPSTAMGICGGIGIVVFIIMVPETSLRQKPVIYARHEPTRRSNSSMRWRKMCRRRRKDIFNSSRSIPPRPNNMRSRSRGPKPTFSSRQRQVVHCERCLERYTCPRAAPTLTACSIGCTMKHVL